MKSASTVRARRVWRISSQTSAEYFAAMRVILFGAAETDELQCLSAQSLEKHLRASEASRNSKARTGGLCVPISRPA